MKKTYFIFGILVLILTSCSFWKNEEDKIIECLAASETLKNVKKEIIKSEYGVNDLYNFSEMNEAATLKYGQLPTPQRIEDSRARTQFLIERTAEFRYKKPHELMNVYQSDMCQEILKEYQDDIYKKISPYFKSMRKDSDYDITCSTFRDQYDKYYDFRGSRYENDLKNGIILTIKGALKDLNKYQLVCVESLVGNDFPFSLSGILVECENETLLSTYLNETKGIKNCMEKP